MSQNLKPKKGEKKTISQSQPPTRGLEKKYHSYLNQLSKLWIDIELKLLRICAGFYIKATLSYLRGCLLSGCLDEFLLITTL